MVWACVVGSCVAGGVHGRGYAWQGSMCAGGIHDRGGCTLQGVHGRGCMAGGTWQGVCMVWGGGACIAGETATELGGTHLTGMHSCYNFV